MRKIVFYISGHGFGHAVRSIAVVKELRRLAPGCELIIKTGAPLRLFESELSDGWRHLNFKADAGMVQKDCLNIDLSATYREARDFFEAGDKITSEEVKFCRSEKIEAIIGDIPPLAFRIADEIGVPGIAIGNFSWDWIYASYGKYEPGFEDLARRARANYEKASLLLRLPFSGDMPAFRTVFDVPLIARTSVVEPAEVRQSLGIEKGLICVLVSSGGFDLPQLDLKFLARLKNFAFIFLLKTAISSENFYYAPIDGFKHQDLVRASDIVVSKPGYGIVSETIANERPLLYTSRGEFPEYPILVEGLKRFGRPCFIPQEDFLRGGWEPYLHEAITKGYSPEPIAINGAEAAAEKIVKSI